LPVGANKGAERREIIPRAATTTTTIGRRALEIARLDWLTAAAGLFALNGVLCALINSNSFDGSALWLFVVVVVAAAAVVVVVVTHSHHSRLRTEIELNSRFLSSAPCVCLRMRSCSCVHVCLFPLLGRLDEATKREKMAGASPSNHCNGNGNSGAPRGGNSNGATVFVGRRSMGAAYMAANALGSR
jgi:hypothetical protein